MARPVLLFSVTFSRNLQQDPLNDPKMTLQWSSKPSDQDRPREVVPMSKFRMNAMPRSHSARTMFGLGSKSKLADHVNQISANLSSNLNPSIADGQSMYIRLALLIRAIRRCPASHFSPEQRKKRKKDKGGKNAIAHISIYIGRPAVAHWRATSSTKVPGHQCPAQTKTRTTPHAARSQTQNRSCQ